MLIFNVILGSADIASSLAAGVRYPIQATDDTQRDNPAKLKIADNDQKDSPAKLKTAAKSPPAPVPAAQAAQTQGDATPPSERDLVHQKRLQRFASDTSDKSGANPTLSLSMISWNEQCPLDQFSPLCYLQVWQQRIPQLILRH